MKVARNQPSGGKRREKGREGKKKKKIATVNINFEEVPITSRIPLRARPGIRGIKMLVKE